MRRGVACLGELTCALRRSGTMVDDEIEMVESMVLRGEGHTSSVVVPRMVINSHSAP